MAGGVFQLYFTAGTIRSAADVRAADQARSAAYHRLLLEAGIYKLVPKGYLGLAHDEGHVEELAVATAWALSRLAG
jgi:glutamate-1-semialdehyde aminotransferase